MDKKIIDTTCPNCGKDMDLVLEDLLVVGCANCGFPKFEGSESKKVKEKKGE